MGILKIHLFLPSIDIQREKYSYELPNQAVPMDGYFFKAEEEKRENQGTRLKPQITRKNFSQWRANRNLLGL